MGQMKSLASVRLSARPQNSEEGAILSTVNYYHPNACSMLTCFFRQLRTRCTLAASFHLMDLWLPMGSCLFRLFFSICLYLYMYGSGRGRVVEILPSSN